MSLYQKSKNQHLIYGCFLLIIALIMQGCFYDEGQVSFRSRAKRLDGIWDYQRVYENGIIKTPTYFIDYVEFTKRNSAKFVLKDGTVFAGTWEYNNHKDRLLIILEDEMGISTIYREWIIQALSTKQLVAEEYTEGDLFRYEMKSR